MLRRFPKPCGTSGAKPSVNTTWGTSHLADSPSLQELPTVIWNSPLSTFLDYSLAELRQLKTYGEKRVRVVLEVFHAVHEAVGRRG